MYKDNKFEGGEMCVNVKFTVVYLYLFAPNLSCLLYYQCVVGHVFFFLNNSFGPLHNILKFFFLLFFSQHFFLWKLSYLVTNGRIYNLSIFSLLRKIIDLGTHGNRSKCSVKYKRIQRNCILLYFVVELVIMWRLFL